MHRLENCKTVKLKNCKINPNWNKLNFGKQKFHISSQDQWATRTAPGCAYMKTKHKYTYIYLHYYLCIYINIYCIYIYIVYSYILIIYMVKATRRAIVRRTKACREPFRNTFRNAVGKSSALCCDADLRITTAAVRKGFVEGSAKGFVKRLCERLCGICSQPNTGTIEIYLFIPLIWKYIYIYIYIYLSIFIYILTHIDIIIICINIYIYCIDIYI